MAATSVQWRGSTLQISRSGYTGEDGFEVIAPVHRLHELSAGLLALQDVEPAGLAARDSLRLEAGICLYGRHADWAVTTSARASSALTASGRSPTLTR